MKILVMASIVCFSVSVAYARDTVEDYSVKEALSLEQAKSALGDGVKFHFGNQEYGIVEKNYGEISTNKKTNAFNKTDKAACQWVFLSAMLALKSRALAIGGNAVINIKSNYKSNLTVSDETFQCGAGAVIAGVALVGTVVKLQQ